METQFGKEENSKITLNLDEFDIDSYDFKPVTKGLGFHDPLEKSKRPTTGPGGSIRKPVRTGSLRASHLQNTPITVSDPGLMTGIDALYGNRPMESKLVVGNKEEKKIEITNSKIKEASFMSMTGAFIVDTLVISLINLVLFSSFYAFAFKTIDLTGIQNFIFNSLPYFAILFGLIFVSYYSLLEPLGTAGKKLWGISTVMVGTKRPITIKSSFIRSLITLLSIPLLFFPLIFDFQGKLSDSTIIEK